MPASDVKNIIHDYQSGFTIKFLSKKYRIPVSRLYMLLKRHGITRNPSESALLRRNRCTLWRKLVPVSTSRKTKILSLPGSLLKEIGVDPVKELEGLWVVEGNRIFLEVRPMKARRKRKSRPLGWRKLSRVRSKRTITRILSLPGKIIKQAGYDPSKDLMGRWEVRGKRLELVIRYAEELGIQ